MENTIMLKTKLTNEQVTLLIEETNYDLRNMIMQSYIYSYPWIYVLLTRYNMLLVKR